MVLAAARQLSDSWDSAEESSARQAAMTSSTYSSCSLLPGSPHLGYLDTWILGYRGVVLLFIISVETVEMLNFRDEGVGVKKEKDLRLN